VFYDVHCPYSDRVLSWLADLGPDLVAPVYRAFALEQVNSDPSARDWRIWDQPLEYAHYSGRQNRRALAAFLAIILAEAAGQRDAVDRFRLAVSHARHAGGGDVSDLRLLLRLAGEAGVVAATLERLFADAGALEVARARIRDDWHAARDEFAIFGVPTLRLGGAAPFYLRLERVPENGQGEALLASVRGLPELLPQVVEIKVPERQASFGD